MIVIVNPTDSVRRLRRLLYKVADESQEVVYLIANPRETEIERSARTIPYGVLESQADEWEKQNGEVIYPREV